MHPTRLREWLRCFPNWSRHLVMCLLSQVCQTIQQLIPYPVFPQSCWAKLHGHLYVVIMPLLAISYNWFYRDTHKHPKRRLGHQFVVCSLAFWPLWPMCIMDLNVEPLHDHQVLLRLLCERLCGPYLHHKVIPQCGKTTLRIICDCKGFMKSWQCYG